MDIKKLNEIILALPDDLVIEREKAMKIFKKFMSLYPFNDHPEKINELKPEDIYNKGYPSFLNFIEHKLRYFGAIFVGSVQYAITARNQIEDFKYLLKISVDDSVSIADKVDAPWDRINYFKGDRHIAKKIIFCYNYEKILPIYNTGHLEYYASEIKPDFKLDYSKSGKNYDDSSIGQKFEYLNDLLLKFKNDILKTDIDNATFMKILYEVNPPPGSSKPNVWLFTVDMELNTDFKSQSENVWNSSQEVKKGDIILFYCAAPTSHIGEIYVAESDSQNDKNTGNKESPTVYISKIIQIKNPINYNELVENPNLKKWHAIKMNFGGEHFKIPNNHWTELKRMILEKNPELEQPISDLDNSIFSHQTKSLIEDKPKKDFLKLLNEIYTPEIKIALGELQRGKNIIFYGPPGSGKTVLSKIISEEYLEKDGYSLYTVHSGTDYYDLVCRIVPQIDEQGNLVYLKEKRFLLDALLSGKVLILDEINRTQIDTALGIFFTYLERDHRINDVEQIRTILKNEIEEDLDFNDLKQKLNDFRIVGTLNVYDKTFLFKLGDALKRRFTFIEITTKPELVNELANPKFKEEFLRICDYDGNQTVSDLIINVFTDLNRIKPLGIGILKEALQFSQYFPDNDAADISVSSLIVPFFENDLNYSTIRSILEKYSLSNSMRKLESLNFGTSDIYGI